MIEALRDTALRLGGEVVRVMRYDPAADDYTAVVRRFADYDRRRAALQEKIDEFAARDDAIARDVLKELEKLETLGDLPFDAILLPEGGERLKQLAPLLAFYDVDPGVVRFLGTTQWDDPSLDSEPALSGGWYAAAPPTQRTDFIARFFVIFWLFAAASGQFGL